MQTTQFFFSKTETKQRQNEKPYRVRYEMKIEGGLMVSINKVTVMSTSRVIEGTSDCKEVETVLY